jgi:MoaA/NifB/PqqE/SkfB family radical SAM enzyme
MPDDIAVPSWLQHCRRFPLDGALLLFDRETGLNALCEGQETSGLAMRAPRVVQFGITNRCNLACTFCSRDLDAQSEWTPESAFDLLADLANEGVLEIAFGGGEPFAFKGFIELVTRLHRETPLAVNLTTNGLALTKQILQTLRGRYGQIRLSLYDDNDWRRTVTLLSDSGARYGVNLLLTPERLPDLETRVLELAALGCGDVLLLSYKGRTRDLHLSAEQAEAAALRVSLLARALTHQVQLKLDVCWGERMEIVPRLFQKNDCGAGREFVVVTSDRRLMACSFHHLSYPIASAADVMRIWRTQRDGLSVAALDPGCARTPDFGIGA